MAAAAAVSVLLGAGSPPAVIAGAPSPAERVGLVDVARLHARIEVDARYAGTRNFTGAVLPGYCERRALLLRAAALRLARVQRGLERVGLGLKVYDGYRPVRASRAMVRWAERSGNARLLEEGYIARRSAHNLATTVDLTLVRPRGGRELDMGTRFDAFTPRSATMNARGRALRNRLTLRRAMERQGFRNYAKEWWHYDSVRPGRRRLDVPVGAGCRAAGT